MAARNRGELLAKPNIRQEGDTDKRQTVYHVIRDRTIAA